MVQPGAVPIVRLLPRPLIVAMAGALLVAGALAPGVAQPVSAAGGSSFVQVANGYRADHGLGPVALHAVVDDIAVQRTRAMAADGALGHDIDYVIDRLEGAGICWSRVGEIVAYNGSGAYEAFGTQWYNSSGHRDIMLGDFTHAGGSREYAGGRWWAVMVFVKICGQSAPSGFSDIGGSKFYDDIVWLVEAEITHGCSPTRFCPDAAVTRGQMASFISRASGLPGTSRDYFRDDEANINRIAAADITSGCDEQRYCPDGAVTRAQMATFLVRALNLPPTSRDFFGDDDGSKHEASINSLAAAGITSGCGSGRYCPDGIVTRGQMAAFLHRAFD
jgi:hypothetical protein